MPCSFTLDHFKEIVDILVENNYEFKFFSDYDREKDHQIILRHDVDFFPENALKLAKFENSHGVKANYHFLLTSETYNPFSKDFKSIIRQIKSYNHKLGLHFDSDLFESEVKEGDKDTTLVDILKFFEAAEIALGELDAFSFHRPTTYGLFESIFNDSNKNKFPICTYDRKFTEEIIYRSDSRRQWRDGCICKQIKGFKGKSFQLLLHPIWWTKEIKTREENILDLKAIKEEQIERYLEKNLSFYKK